jgi:hypothetical protein
MPLKLRIEGRAMDEKHDLSKLDNILFRVLMDSRFFQEFRGSFLSFDACESLFQLRPAPAEELSPEFISGLSSLWEEGYVDQGVIGGVIVFILKPERAWLESKALRQKLGQWIDDVLNNLASQKQRVIREVLLPELVVFDEQTGVYKARSASLWEIKFNEVDDLVSELTAHRLLVQRFGEHGIPTVSLYPASVWLSSNLVRSWLTETQDQDKKTTAEQGNSLLTLWRWVRPKPYSIFLI